MDRQLSNAIYLLRLPLALMVVVLHISTPPLPIGIGFSDTGMGILNAVKVCGFEIANLAVPCFYMMSGFLLLFKSRKYAQVLKEKSRTLLLPYIVWNVVAAVYIYLTQGIRCDSFFALFIAPANFPLWFLRDLIVLTLCYPIFKIIIKKLGWLSIAIATIVYLIYQTSSFFYFFAGCYFALNHCSLRLSRAKLWVIGLVCVVLYLLACFNWQLGWGIYHRLWVLTGSVSLIIFVYNIWGNNPVSERLKKLSKSSYFIYLAHKVGPTYIAKLPFEYLPVSQATQIACFLISPLIATAICIGIYLIAVKLLPKSVDINWRPMTM